MSFTKKHLIPVAGLCVFLAIAETHGEEAGKSEPALSSIGWYDLDYPYLIVDQSMSDVLLEFGHNSDVSVEVSADAGKIRVHGYDHGGSSGEFLEHLAGKHGLDWLLEGHRLFVSAIDERVTRSWSGGVGNLKLAEAALAAAGVDDSRYRIGGGSGEGVLSLTAPPRYMAQAVPVIERALAPKATQTVNVIHGRSRNGGS